MAVLFPDGLQHIQWGPQRAHADRWLLGLHLRAPILCVRNQAGVFHDMHRSVRETVLTGKLVVIHLGGTTLSWHRK